MQACRRLFDIVDSPGFFVEAVELPQRMLPVDFSL